MEIKRQQSHSNLQINSSTKNDKNGNIYEIIKGWFCGDDKQHVFEQIKIP